MEQMMSIGVPPGVGEAFWVNSKLEDFKKKHGVGQLLVHVVRSSFNRCGGTHLRFPWASQILYTPFALQPPGIVRAPSGTYQYRGKEQNVQAGNHVLDFLLIPNQHLEEGGRIEDWLPEYESNNENLGDHYRFETSDIKRADAILSGIEHNRCLFYLGPERGNLTYGHNRGTLWKPEEWIRLGDLIHEEWGLHILVVGSKHDHSYYLNHIWPLLGDRTSHWHDCIGQTDHVAHVYALGRKSEFFVSYQCGLGIGAVYLDIPVVMWWRPQGNSMSSRYDICPFEDMRHCWAPHKTLGKTYLPQIYTRCSPESIFEGMKAAGWVDKDPTCVTVDSKWYNEKYFDRDVRSTRGGGYWKYGEWEGAEVILTSIMDTLGLQKSAKLLDVGCGRGYWVQQALKLGLEAYGFDFSEWAVRNRMSSEWRVWEGDILDKTAYRGSYDLVMSFSVLEHVYQDKLSSAAVNLFDASSRFVLLVVDVEETECSFDEGVDMTQLDANMRFLLSKGHVSALSRSSWTTFLDQTAEECGFERMDEEPLRLCIQREAEVRYSDRDPIPDFWEGSKKCTSLYQRVQ